eukprot:CAMPEP_0118718276 /NCGR_PEP_ID=MMETSP0800-20121206/28704_1 /TAXON_ID=210618 ORGANISM="Striatella unipunctata, Strain CCMP2910" /NCGR_SAMPLE_ID=MMETSP0800 /ASSEMBLY_ACC=CAM_ASM_000638 /LENGTH=240 /DNA_ID=CAMNT_0006625265 /DNA_START=199 /DNA_END=918 /DNA_ORIENTATION=+
MANLAEFAGRELVSVDKANIDFGSNKKEEKDDDDTTPSLSTEEADAFCKWFKDEALPDQVSVVRITDRLTSSPAVVTDSESGAMRRMMRFVDTDGSQEMALGKQQLEINPKHPIMIGLNSLREKEPPLAQVLAAQVFDNCLMVAGLMGDGRSMVPRLNDLMLSLVKTATQEFPNPPKPYVAPAKAEMIPDPEMVELAEKLERGELRPPPLDEDEDDEAKDEEEMELNWIDDNDDRTKSTS